ncbi:MAG: hypothetical protein JRJ39_03805 [Deltaproteobacteria bacterium]|nr:hypothetical protein [Deltaproteobacteria bacterium]MBW1847648.1 hypothetical protein [Deltaproteobacteria bacterium]
MILRKIALILPVLILVFASFIAADTIVDYTYDADGTMKKEEINSSTPPQVSISADPVSIQPSESTTFTWSSVDATSCEIDQGIGNVDLNGSLSVSPTESTKYTITATGPAVCPEQM